MTFGRRASRFLLAGLFVLVGVVSATAQSGYIEASLRRGGQTAQHVIITVQAGHEGEVLDRLKKFGASVKSQHPSINGVAATIQGDYVNDLAKHGVVSITPDAILHASAASGSLLSDTTQAALDPNAPQGPSVSTLRLSLGLSAGAAANLASGVINGTGVGIAIVDSGIDPAPDFAGRIKGFYDFTKLDRFRQPTQPAPYDDLGHGTHIAGLIASAGAAPGYVFQGVAPNANLVVFKVLDKNGAGSTSSVIAAIEYIVSHRKALGVQVINLSQRRCSSTPWCRPLSRRAPKALSSWLPLAMTARATGASTRRATHRRPSPSESPTAKPR